MFLQVTKIWQDSLKNSTFLSDLTDSQILANIPLVTIASVATSQTAFFFFWLAIHSQKTIFKN
jgi:hypothetical protein